MHLYNFQGIETASNEGWIVAEARSVLHLVIVICVMSTATHPSDPHTGRIVSMFSKADAWLHEINSFINLSEFP
jgi:hypothetical protein